MFTKTKALVVSALTVGAVAANAALPSSVTTVVNGIQDDGQALFNAVFPVIGTLVGLYIVIKLFKRFTRAI